MSQIILAGNANLRGKDLNHIYDLAKNSKDPDVFAMFKKKEPVNSMAKSILKHRIQTLTGLSATEIEEEMGFPSTREGGGVPLDVLRRLAHYLILDAMGQLDESKPQTETKVADAISRKRGAQDGVASSSGSADETVLPKKPRTSRKSMAPLSSAKPAPSASKRASRRSMVPELLSSGNIAADDSVACRLTQAKGVEREKKVEGDEVKVEDLGLGPNPTQAMIKQKRRSLAVHAAKKGPKVSPPVEAEPTPVPDKTDARRSTRRSAEKSTPLPVVASQTRGKEMSSAKTIDKSTTVVDDKKPSSKKAAKSLPDLSPRKSAFTGTDGAAIYLAEGNPLSLSYDTCTKLARDFTGANLTILHTPVDWQAMDMYTFAKGIKAINASAGLDQYLILAGCGIANVNLFYDALYSQTKHVQIVVFDRADQNLEDHKEGTCLRETTSFFLLAYFFPNCDQEKSEPCVALTRPGFTNNFHVKSIEDLENTIVYVLSEKGDWILDVLCQKREISLAAQKSGRNALAVDPSLDMLFVLKDKASLIAEKNDKTFRKDFDGVIQHF